VGGAKKESREQPIAISKYHANVATIPNNNLTSRNRVATLSPF